MYPVFVVLVGETGLSDFVDGSEPHRLRLIPLIPDLVVKRNHILEIISDRSFQKFSRLLHTRIFASALKQIAGPCR